MRSLSADRHSRGIGNVGSSVQKALDGKVWMEKVSEEAYLA
jgi:hypothetical protein